MVSVLNLQMINASLVKRGITRVSLRKTPVDWGKKDVPGILLNAYEVHFCQSDLVQNKYFELQTWFYPKSLINIIVDVKTQLYKID